MATVARQRLSGCDGFRIELSSGLVGWVEETWLGPSGEPTAMAVRMLDGRRGLLVADEVEAVDSEGELIVVRPRGVLLELDAPRVDVIVADAELPSVVSASWRTTGALLEPPPSSEAERPVWQSVALLYAGITLLASLEIGLAFLVAYLVAGSAY